MEGEFFDYNGNILYICKEFLFKEHLYLAGIFFDKIKNDFFQFTMGKESFNFEGVNIHPATEKIFKSFSTEFKDKEGNLLF